MVAITTAVVKLNLVICLRFELVYQPSKPALY